MNTRYFACMDCKVYVDPGYRWAYWELEKPRIVVCNEGFTRESILNATRYWNPPINEKPETLIQQVFPAVRQFLDQHNEHKMVYGEAYDLFPDGLIESGIGLEWKLIGYLADSFLSPRYLAEDMGMRTWAQVEAHVAGMRNKPWWAEKGFEDFLPKVRAKFEQVVRANGVS